jgi:hypothetical protein
VNGGDWEDVGATGSIGGVMITWDEPITSK